MVVVNKHQGSKIYKKGGGRVFVLLLLLLSDIAYAIEMPCVNMTQSAEQVWQRQQFLVTLQIDTNDPFARVEADSFKQKGWRIIAFPMERIEGEKETRLILKWAIFSFVAGKQMINLPEIRYRPNRGRKQILQSKEMSILVKRLPVYIPPTMPVGKVRLQSVWKNGSYIHNDGLTEWQVNVIGENVVEQTMPPIKPQIRSTEALQILPIQRSKETLTTELGIINHGYYKVPLKALLNGRLNFPEIEVQYFEPISGELQKVSLNLPVVFSFNKELFWVITSIIVFVVLFLLLKLVFFTNKFFINYCQKRQAICLLNKAVNYRQVRSAVNQLSIVEGWEANLSLFEFLQYWEKKFGKSTKLEEKIECLHLQYFSGRSK